MNLSAFFISKSFVIKCFPVSFEAIRCQLAGVSHHFIQRHSWLAGERLPTVGEKKKAMRILAKQSVRQLESWYLVLGGLPGRKLTYGAHSVHTPDEMKARHWVKRRDESNQPKRMKSIQDERSPITRMTFLEQIGTERTD